MEVQLPETNKHSFTKPEQQGSIYGETPLFSNKLYLFNNTTYQLLL